jgi:hypothetical protein
LISPDGGEGLLEGRLARRHQLHIVDRGDHRASSLDEQGGELGIRGNRSPMLAVGTAGPACSTSIQKQSNPPSIPKWMTLGWNILSTAKTLRR